MRLFATLIVLGPLGWSCSDDDAPGRGSVDARSPVGERDTGQKVVGPGASPDASLADGASADGASADGGSADGGLRPPDDEQCNQVDDNGNSLIDEGCPCEAGALQPCWPGTPGRRGVGVCADGQQQCMRLGDFFTWGPCRDAVVPAGEIPDNGLDEDCDGSDANAGDCLPFERGRTCADGLDEDCDGLIDCDDPDCDKHCEMCTVHEEVCAGGVDEDCDGLTDCADPDCAEAPECNPEQMPGCLPEFPFIIEILCDDQKDNDCDGRVDCDDPECRQPGQCGCLPEEVNCQDRVDDDCDGYTDCGDEDCEQCEPGSFRWCDEPTECLWGRQECLPDGRWGACIEDENPPGDCGGAIYDLQCCVRSNQCCQNFPQDQASVGNCPQVDLCPQE